MNREQITNWRFYLLIALCGFSLLFTGCSRKQKPEQTLVPGTVEEQVGGTAIVRANAEAFSRLSENERTVAYYLSQAVLAGREISREQIYPGQAKSCRFLERIGANLEYGVISSSLEPFRHFLMLIQIHDGFYDQRTGKKINPGDFGDRELTYLMFVAQANSGGALGELSEVQLMRFFIVDTLLKPTVDSVLCARDSVSGSWTILPAGYYGRVPPEEAQKFRGRYPLNSRLIMRDEAIAEQIYRAGDEEVAEGLCADQLKRVIENLEKGRPYLPAQRVEAVDALIRSLRSGNLASADSAAALQLSQSAPVDFVLGFGDTRFDPLGRKGLWTGMVFIEDAEAQAKVDRLLPAAPELLATLPGGHPGLEATHRLRAVQLLTASGANGPRCPDVYRDPPSFDSLQTSGRSLLFTNVITARASAQVSRMEAQLCDDDLERSQAEKYAPDIAFTRAVLEEMIGFAGSGSSTYCANAAQKDDALLREALRQVQVLWLMADPHLVDVGLLPDADAWNESYLGFARKFQIALSDTTGSFNQGVLKLLGNYWQQAGALVLSTGGQKSRYRPADRMVMREKASELALLLRNLLQNGSAQSRREFVSRYSAGSESKISDQVGYFIDEAFILPVVRAKFNPMGGIEEVRLEQPVDFNQEMLIYSGLEPVKRQK